MIAAFIFEINGIKSILFREPVPTLLLSYAVKNLSCSAGIVITAFYDLKEYNGFKVYDENDCQVMDKVANEIQMEIDKVDIYQLNFTGEMKIFRIY